MKDFKLLPINLFGELLQCLYDSEVNFAIDWTWDGGFDWGFEGLKKSASTNAIAKKIDNTNLEEAGGLILHEYATKFNGLDSEGKPNKMYHFLEKVALYPKMKDFMNLTLENTERGIEIHRYGDFVAEVAREDEGMEIVQTYNRAKSLGLIEVQGVEKTVWGLATNSNPDDTEFFEMPKQTAVDLLNYLNSK